MYTCLVSPITPKMFTQDVHSLDNLNQRYITSVVTFLFCSDETLSSTDSPVLKPPKLKEFGQGDVVYKHQAVQVHVLPSADFSSA